jgi:tetratricopeptide (TPR) repeat protein
MNQPNKKPEIIGIKVDAGGEVNIETYIASQPKYNPAYNLPYPPSPNFVGREGILARLHDQLQIGSCAIAAALAGMAGVGKTELALQYASKYGRSYSGGCYWMGMRDRVLDKVLTQHIKDEFQLDLPPEKTDKGEIAQWCWREWERNLPSDSNVLIVLDNVDDAHQIGGMLPGNSFFRLLVTTRTHALDATFLEELIEELTDAAALEFLEKLVGNRVRQELVAAKRLCHDLLGNLPLGIELAGRYLHQDEELSIAEFIAELSIVQEALDREDTRAVYSTMTAERGVKSALELSWRRLASQSQTIAKLLGLCAPRAIPWELVAEMAEINEGQKTESVPLRVEKERVITEAGRVQKLSVKRVRQQLGNLHLIKWDKEGKTATLHTLVRNFFQNKAQTNDSLKQIFAETMFQRASQTKQDMNLEQVNKIGDVVSHIEEVALHYSCLLSDDEFIWPFIGAARFYDSQGLYAAAEPWYVMCLEKVEQRLGTEHPNTATSLNNLAELYQFMGNYTAAQPLYERAIQVREKRLGENHPDTATSLNYLAELYYWMGEYTAAQPLYERALQIREDRLGANHPDTAISLNNLAVIYDSIGNYAAALPLYERALQIREDRLGENHRYTAISLNNLAYLYRLMGNYKAAQPLYERALQIREDQLGANHPDTAAGMNNLAVLYKSMGNYKAALPLSERAFQIRTEQLGVNHPSTTASQNNLAELYKSMGNYETALTLFECALQIRTEQLGINHPDTITSQNDLAELYRLIGNYKVALPLSERALQIRTEQLGVNHPDTAVSMNNLAELYRSMGNNEAAIPLSECALQIRTERLGVNHPDTALSMNNLAGLYESMGRDNEAKPLYRKALEICEQSLDLEHPNTVACRENYAQFLRKS